MCSIKPFEYKSKVNESASYQMAGMTMNKSGGRNSEIVFESRPKQEVNINQQPYEFEKHTKQEIEIEAQSNLNDSGIPENDELNKSIKKQFPKENSYESPEKSSAEDEWNYKLPTLKSSSGHENMRNSESEQLNIKNENESESVSVDMLEKSPEMTVFISEKDLSPSKSNCKNR